MFPYKGTTNEENSFKKAIFLASSIVAEITLLTCLEERHTFGFFKTKTSKREFEKECKLAEKQHERLKKLANDHNVSCSSKIVTNGLASIKILEFAKKHDIDLIIMTKTKLSSNYEKLHYHSTIENVFQNSPCSILVLE